MTVQSTQQTEWQCLMTTRVSHERDDSAHNAIANCKAEVESHVGVVLFAPVIKEPII